MDILNTLKCLARHPAVSGDETAFCLFLQKTLKTTGLRMETLGNSFVVFPEVSDPDAPLLLTHLDEPGLVISAVEEHGFLRFRPVGGIAVADLANQEVRVGPNKIPGVIGLRPPHVLSEQERREKVKPEELFIDLGIKNIDGLVQVGDSAVVHRELLPVGTTRCLGRALGDKAVVTLLSVLVLRRNKALRCPVAFCAGHYLGFHGATEISEYLAPHRAVVVDTLPARSFQNTTPLLELGEGPGIVTGPMVDPEFTTELKTWAAAARVPFRSIPLAERRITDAWKVQVAAGGVVLGLLALPVRYPGSFGEMVDMKDLRHLFLLLEALDRGKGVEPCSYGN